MPEDITAGSAPQVADVEVVAISTLIGALTPLPDDAKARVVSYVFARLGMNAPASISRTTNDAPPPTPQFRGVSVSSHVGLTDIRSLRDLKQPHSAIEMAAVVAYYLSEAAPEEMRLTEISAEDIEKYFKQADYPLPGRARQTLFDAKNAGYLDPGSKRGAYKLNPVGHNLVAHRLPGKVGDTPVGARRSVKKAKKRNRN